jgi:hypothetical protein
MCKSAWHGKILQIHGMWRHKAALLTELRLIPVQEFLKRQEQDMKVLKILGTAVCSLLLFLAISVLSIAFLLNSTVLSPKFMNAQIEKLDTSEMARDLIDEELKEQLPQGSDFLMDISLNIIENEDDLIKAQITPVINDAYAYLLGDKDTLQLSVSLAAIKQDLKNNIWDAAIEYLKNETANMSEAEFNQYVLDIAGQIPPETYPAELKALPKTIRDQVIVLFIKDLSGRDTFESGFFGLTPEAAGEVKNTVQQYLNEYIDQIPDSFAIEEGIIDSDTMDTLGDVRTVIGYFKMVYIWLYVFILVMAGLIFLINWSDIRASMRSLGIDLVIFGILDLAGILVMKSLSLMTTIPGYKDIPVSLQNWIQGIVSDITGIMMTFSIAMVAIGAVLLTVSFFVKKRQTAD